MDDSGRRKSDAARKMSGDQGVGVRRRSSLMSDDSTCFEDVYGDADGGAAGGMLPSAAVADLLAVLGLANLLGLLANDFVFDGSAALARGYYCPLLETFGDWRVVRMLGMLVAGFGVLGGLLARGAAADWGVAAALAGGGGYAFYTTLRTTAALCATAAGHGEEEARVASVWCWHLGIGAVLGTSLLLKAGQLLPVLPRGSHDDDEDDDDEDDDVDRHGSPNKDKHE